jgi:hypothetical protein
MLTACEAIAAADWAEEQFKKCESVDDIDKKASVDWVNWHGSRAGLSPAQREVAQGILLQHFMKAIGRC